jgi:hypothetical protein
MRDEPRTCNECGCELHEFDGPDADFCSLCLEDQEAGRPMRGGSDRRNDETTHSD